MVGDAILAHGAGERLLLHREHPAEAAALVGTGEIHQGDSFQRGEERTHLVEPGHDALTAAAQAELPEGMAALMKADAVGKPTGDCLHMQHVEQELAQLVGPIPHRLHLGRVGEQVPVVVPNHRDAAPRGTDHVGEGLEDLEEPLGERCRRVRRTGIGHGLAAAGLRLREVHLASQPLEQGDRGQSHLGVELVDVAGDEQPNVDHGTPHLGRRRSGYTVQPAGRLLPASSAARTAQSLRVRPAAPQRMRRRAGARLHREARRAAGTVNAVRGAAPSLRPRLRWFLLHSGSGT